MKKNVNIYPDIIENLDTAIKRAKSQKNINQIIIVELGQLRQILVLSCIKLLNI